MSRTPARIVGAVALSWSLSACVHTNAAVMDSSLKLARVCPAAVKLYSSPSKVEGDYTEIAMLNSTGASQFTNESQMMASMRQAAAKVGATGVILDNINEPGAGAKIAAAVFNTVTERKGKSVAIYVAGDTARVAAVCRTPNASPASTVAVPAAPNSVAAVSPREAAAPASMPALVEPARDEPTSDGTWAQASIGRPRSGADIESAKKAFASGSAAMGAHEWEKAEQSFQRAILYDGSVAKYHAAMGSLMVLLRRWADAEASYTAAMLIDVDNPEYRRKVKEARSRR